MTTPLRLSEAIRLGSLLVPQCFDRTFSYDTEDDARAEPTHACAIGAAMLALGLKEENIVNEDIIGDRWPWTTAILGCDLQPVPSHPVLGRRHNWSVCSNLFTIAQYVAHLNDCHRWTREEIAGWIETQEQRFAAPPPDTDRLAIVAEKLALALARP